MINEYDDDDIFNDFIPTKNANEEPFELTEEIQKGHYVSGHVILN